MESSSKTVLSNSDIRRTLVRVAHEIVEKNGDRRIALVGIHRRGVPLARRLHKLIAQLYDEPVPLGQIDISSYRDDSSAQPTPVVNATELPFELAEHSVVLVDDVLYTGRTVRAAIEALFDRGRPDRVQLAVLADRGHRELPIRPDYVGKNLPTSRLERVNVRLEEVDGADEVTISIDSARAVTRGRP